MNFEVSVFGGPLEGAGFWGTLGGCLFLGDPWRVVVFWGPPWRVSVFFKIYFVGYSDTKGLPSFLHL